MALQQLVGALKSARLFRGGAPCNWHICYALAMDSDTVYADLVTISALCVRRIYPTARITILTDDGSLSNLGPVLQRLSNVASNIRSIGKFEGSAHLRSRFVKTQVRSILEGDFLYLDADTVAVAEFSNLFRCEAPLCAAIDRNRVNPWGGFPAWVVPDFERLGWPHPTKLYLNAGILFWKDCATAHALGQLWHQSWLRYTKMVDNPADQPAFNHSISVLGIEPKIMDDVFNARVGVSPIFANGARIYHLLSGDERADGTFVDEALKRYRATGQVDFSLIDDAAKRGHPWMGEFCGPSKRL